MSNSLWPHELQHTRPPCPSPTPRVYPNPCPLSRWCHPTISSCSSLLLLPSIFPSIRIFSNESVLCIRWPKYWSFSFNIISSSEYSGFVSLRMDWLDLLAVQGTIKSLLQYHSSKASILWLSAFFIVQLVEKEMATHPTVLAWRIPGTDEPGGLPSMGSHRVRHDWSDLTSATARCFLTFYFCIPDPCNEEDIFWGC